MYFMRAKSFCFKSYIRLNVSTTLELKKKNRLANGARNVQIKALCLAPQEWKIQSTFTLKTNPYFRFIKGKAWEERELVIFLKITRLITISMETSRRDLFIDIVVDRFMFKNNQITLSPVSPSYTK